MKSTGATGRSTDGAGLVALLVGAEVDVDGCEWTADRRSGSSRRRRGRRGGRLRVPGGDGVLIVGFSYLSGGYVRRQRHVRRQSTAVTGQEQRTGSRRSSTGQRNKQTRPEFRRQRTNASDFRRMDRPAESS